MIVSPHGLSIYPPIRPTHISSYTPTLSMQNLNSPPPPLHPLPKKMRKPPTTLARVLHAVSWPLWVLGGVAGALMGLNLGIYLTSPRADRRGDDGSGLYELVSSTASVDMKKLADEKDNMRARKVRKFVLPVTVVGGFVVGTW